MRLSITNPALVKLRKAVERVAFPDNVQPMFDMLVEVDETSMRRALVACLENDITDAELEPLCDFLLHFVGDGE